MEPFSGQTEKNTAIMLLEPKADSETFTKLRDRLERFVADRIHHVLCDLCGVDYVNSSVLAFLVDLKKRCEKHGLTFTLVNVTDKVRTILRTTRLDSFLLPPESTA